MPVDPSMSQAMEQAERLLSEQSFKFVGSHLFE